MNAAVRNCRGERAADAITDTYRNVLTDFAADTRHDAARSARLEARRRSESAHVRASRASTRERLRPRRRSRRAPCAPWLFVPCAAQAARAHAGSHFLRIPYRCITAPPIIRRIEHRKNIDRRIDQPNQIA
ncbi:hypothetical protein GSH05_16855 [Burkholderia pseudomallei]|uniref:Uncharacterized protein n=1 Tax=Burkholderia pseudomallei TaxID=28450 RepID=A0AAX0U9J5_BURPE|nr:hypothetical protein BHT10_32295 [Burkholderia pseudomallei]AYX31978.1 hypothetical protein EGY16_28915 [Burkholderia pseudomallei]KAA8765390.1 hypothetical protein F5D26_23310 [Burkholderia pseudomallei]MBM5576879.1 hypothetical protein [Burkholderia pseudomallei]MBM5583543.1 hypothetical protein [Burkholderia pseudomallei]